MISIRPMRSEEYRQFEESAVALYADESARAGRVSRGDSLNWARVETKKILTKGIETPNHLFYVVEDGIGLHVYAFNEGAVHLYRKLGYRETDLVMSKDLRKTQ